MKTSNQSFYQENLYFKAPRCICPGELCGPIDWPQKHGEFAIQRRMPLNHSRADRSESGDETISSVHNQDLQVATRSTAEIVTGTTENPLINQSNDPLLSSTAPVFAGANIGSISGCTFQIFHGNVKIVQNEKKRGIVTERNEDV